MTTEHDSVNPCTTLGHYYSTVTVVRCPHLNSFEVWIRVWHDTDLDDPAVHFEQRLDFGPFDSISEVERRVLDLTAVAFCNLITAGPL